MNNLTICKLFINFFKLIGDSSVASCRLLAILLSITIGLALPTFISDDAQAQIIPTERRIEWSPGVPGGIPNYSVQNNVMDFGAVGDGVTDDTSAIRDALNATDVGYAVLLPAGTYRLTAQVGIPAGKVLRGEGPSKTMVIFEHSKTGFDIGSDQGSVSTSLTNAASKGDTTITVADASMFSPNSYAQLIRPSDEVSQIALVTSVSGNQLTFTRPLYENYETGTLVDMVPMAKDAGIEDMFLYTDWPDHTGYVNAAKVRMSRAARSWVKNIETNGYVGQEVFVSDCHQCEVRDSYFHQSLEGAMQESQFYIYGVELRNGTTDSLVENNIFDYYRHAMVIQHDNAGGNVFGYNMSWSVYTRNESTGQTVRSLQTDLEVHHQRVHQVLFEGNHAEYAALHYNTNYEQTHNTLLRNRITQAGISAATLNHIIGNELPLAKYVVERDSWFPTNNIRIDADAGTIVHGNYIEGYGGLQWDNNISDREVPVSYYLVERPDWFCDLEWPAFGGDLMPANEQRSPAEVRYWSIRFPEMAPTDLIISADAGSADLSWTNNSDNDVDFVVVRSTDGEFFERIGETTETNFTDDTIEDGAEYFYYVRARNHLGGEYGDDLGGESLASNMVSTNSSYTNLNAPNCGGSAAPQDSGDTSGGNTSGSTSGSGGVSDGTSDGLTSTGISESSSDGSGMDSTITSGTTSASTGTINTSGVGATAGDTSGGGAPAEDPETIDPENNGSCAFQTNSKPGQPFFLLILGLGLFLFWRRHILI